MSDAHPRVEDLNAYVLEELDGAARREVARHLEACSACRTEVTILQDALTSYRDAEPEALDGRGLDRLLAVQRQARRRRGTGRGWRPAQVGTAAAAAILIFLSGMWVGRQGGGGFLDGGEVGGGRAVVVRPQAAVDAAPRITFAVTEVDRLGGMATRDTTWN